MKRLKLAFAALIGLMATPGATQAPTPIPPKPVASPAATPAMPATGAPVLTKTDADAWLDGFFPYAIQRGDIAGAVVVIVKDGQVVTQRGYGFADAAARKPVDPDTTMFRPGSVSKLFTWTAVMQLVEQGKIDLDADVNTYLDFKIPPRDGKPITMRNLMTHTPGFEEAVRGLIASGTKASPLDVVLKRWTPTRIFDAGTTPAYSNYATALGGYIVQRVSGVPFDDYVERNIFGRLGMTHSSFRQPLPANLQPLMSKGYQLGSGKPMPYEIIEAAPAGSLAATGSDLGRFMIAHLAKGGPLLSPQTAEMMHTTYLDILPPLNRMALGFYEQNQNGHRVIMHGGDTRLFHSALWLFIDDNVGMFVSLNSTGKDGVTGALRSTLLSEFADRYFPAPAPKDGRVDAKTAAEHARMMTGNYIVSRRAQTSFLFAGALLGQMTVSLNPDGTLLIAGNRTIGGAPRKWVEIAPFVWREVGGKQRMAAKVVDGKVQRFSFDAGSPISLFERVPWYADKSWLNPLAWIAFAILLITALSWPAGAIARRVYGTPLHVTGEDRKAYHLVRGFSILSLVTAAGWAQTLTAMGSNPNNVNGGLDTQVVMLQVAGLVFFFGSVGIALWNAWRTWKGKASLTARIWSLLIVLSTAIILWGAISYGLIGFGLQY